jgi:hypothetical protein
VKFLPSQLAYLTTDREQRANLRALASYLGFLAALVTLYAVLFHVIKTTWKASSTPGSPGSTGRSS